MPARRAFTIGHSTHALDAFAALLEGHGVRRVADVRRFPGSRRHPQFNREALAAGMGASFIPDLALISVRDDIVVRSMGKRPPVRVIWAATLKDSYCSPARQAMLDVLAEVGAEFAANRRTLALAS